jgi:D-alanine-D-alanine ligase
MHSVAVLLGGWSAEREVSLASGRAVIDALRSRGHDVCQMDPAEIDILSYPWSHVEVAFVALHGGFGEDGTLQTILDELAVPYTGCGPDACRLAMSKRASKACFARAGVPTPDYHVATDSDSPAATAEVAIRLGYPVVTKPDSQGSSIGVTIVREPAGLADALAQCFHYDSRAIVERFVTGRELTVAILDGQPLPPIEIRTPRGFYDYQAKYHDDMTQYLFDLDLSPMVLSHIEQVAVGASAALGCRGVVRVDLRLDADLRPWVLEVNAVPGLTDHSLVPKSAARAGISFPELCDRLIRTPLHGLPYLLHSQAA